MNSEEYEWRVMHRAGLAGSVSSPPVGEYDGTIVASCYLCNPVVGGWTSCVACVGFSYIIPILTFLSLPFTCSTYPDCQIEIIRNYTCTRLGFRLWFEVDAHNNQSQSHSYCPSRLASNQNQTYIKLHVDKSVPAVI